MPKRIQRKRTKGWRMPPNAVYVGRPTEWGNPYVVREQYFYGPAGIRVEIRDRDHAIDLFRWWIDDCERRGVPLRIGALCGKNLACWCPLDQPCHADVLLELANR